MVRVATQMPSASPRVVCICDDLPEASDPAYTPASEFQHFGQHVFAQTLRRHKWDCYYNYPRPYYTAAVASCSSFSAGTVATFSNFTNFTESGNTSFPF